MHQKKLQTMIMENLGGGGRGGKRGVLCDLCRSREVASDSLLQPDACNSRKQSTIWFTLNFLYRKTSKASS